MNYAIRYTRTQEALDQLDEIAQQISEKLKKKKFRTKLITVKGKQRAPDAPVETKKFMGHGKCTNFTKAIACDATDDVTIISKYAKQVYTSLNVPIEDLRGIGVTASKFVESSGGSTMQATSLSQYFRKSGSEEEPKR
jgi:DNA repair protein REV1